MYSPTFDVSSHSQVENVYTIILLFVLRFHYYFTLPERTCINTTHINITIILYKNMSSKKKFFF